MSVEIALQHRIQGAARNAWSGDLRNNTKSTDLSRMSSLSRRLGTCLALLLCAPLAHAEMVVWKASGTIGYIYQPLNPNNEIPFPVSAGESVTLDMTVDTTEQGYISTLG